MPWIAPTIGAVGGLLGAGAASNAAAQQRAAQERMLRQQMEMTAPYREFGAEELAAMRNWLSSPEGQYRPPTMEEVQAGPGYASRLGAVESSAAAKGSLFSGNALRNIGEFGASEYAGARQRGIEDYMNEYNRRMGRVNLGYGAATGGAGQIAQATPAIAGTYGAQGNAMAQGIGDIASSITGGIGAYQGQQNWQDYLNRAYPSLTSTEGSF